MVRVMLSYQGKCLPPQQDYNTQAFLIDGSVIEKHQLVLIFGSYTVDRQRYLCS